MAGYGLACVFLYLIPALPDFQRFVDELRPEAEPWNCVAESPT